MVRVMVMRLEVIRPELERADVAAVAKLASPDTAADGVRHFDGLGRFAEPRLRRASWLAGKRRPTIRRRGRLRSPRTAKGPRFAGKGVRRLRVGHGHHRRRLRRLAAARSAARRRRPSEVRPRPPKGALTHARALGSLAFVMFVVACNSVAGIEPAAVRRSSEVEADDEDDDARTTASEPAARSGLSPDGGGAAPDAEPKAVLATSTRARSSAAASASSSTIRCTAARPLHGRGRKETVLR